MLRLDMTDAERREVRQSLNKLRGKHNKLLDQAEWERLLASTQRENLKRLLDAVGEKLPDSIDDSAREGGGNMVPESYELIIECIDEADRSL